MLARFAGKLVKKYQKIFSIGQSSGLSGTVTDYLKIQKDPAIATLDLNLKMDISKMKMIRNDNLILA